MSTAFEVRVLHDSCAECDVLAAKAVMTATAARDHKGSMLHYDVPEGKVFPQLVHAAEADVAAEDWKLVGLHWKCADCLAIADNAKKVATDHDSRWGFQTRAGQNGGEHSMKAIRVI